MFKLSFRNMLNRPLNTVLSLVLFTLGVGMISLLLHVQNRIQQQMDNNLQGIDMVVGAKGSPLQLILSAVYQIDAPTGNIPLEEANKLRQNWLVQKAIPLSYGDNYKGFRIVGTNEQYPQLYNAKVETGRLWTASFDVTIGAGVAEKLHLKVGDTFTEVHGLVDGGEEHKEHAYKVAGIFNRTHSVLDQLILTATESVWEIHEHHHHEHENEHDEVEEKHHEEKEITALLIQFRNPMGMVQLPRMINKNTNLQAAVPAFEVDRLYNIMGVGIDLLTTIAYTIIAVSGVSVFISLYSSLKARQTEMAFMRAYGATRWQLVSVVLWEGILLALIGFLFGVAFSRVGLMLLSSWAETGYHYSFTGVPWINGEWWLLLIAMLIGGLAAVLPAVHAFRINISKTLADA